jgi:hypothetical protein
MKHWSPEDLAFRCQRLSLRLETLALKPGIIVQQIHEIEIFLHHCSPLEATVLNVCQIFLGWIRAVVGHVLIIIEAFSSRQSM